MEGQPGDDYLGAPTMGSNDNTFAHTLEDLVQSEGVLSVEKAVELVESIAHRLAQLHKGSSIYGRLSPSNIELLHGEPTLRNASMASAFDDVQETSSDVAGVVDYMAPEQALNSSRADWRADVYGLGCVLYFMLTGRAPFPTGSVSERLLKHQFEEPAPLGTVREEVPAGLAAICSRMLEKKPENRYQSSEDVIQAIKSWRTEGS